MVTHWWNLFIGIDIYLLHNVRYTIKNRKPHFGPNGRIVTSQEAQNRIWTSAFGFGPYTIRGFLAGHYSVIGPSVRFSISDIKRYNIIHQASN